MEATPALPGGSSRGRRLDQKRNHDDGEVMPLAVINDEAVREGLAREIEGIPFAGRDEKNLKMTVKKSRTIF
ncbi:MAG: hypothetical protein M0C28_16770 [Candidatus Moduliflexus flocculans]|nr:hypothetical protein [Candidatus Moduliflexus flocculans]